VSDTVNMPRYPRHKVRALCPPAVRGEITAADTVHWRGVRGTVAARGDALVTGETLRDVMMHQVLNTASFPEIVFTLDSLVGLTHHGDTLVGSAAGTMAVRGEPTPVIAAVRAWRISGGMRVLAKWHVPAAKLAALTPNLHIYSLGIQSRVFRNFWMGADLVLRPVGSATN
jgi:hypothetical protein